MKWSEIKCLAVVVWAVASAQLAIAADDDALALQSAPEPAKRVEEQPLRAYVEAAFGNISHARGAPSQALRRASLDLNWTWRPAPSWRVVVSDRLDDRHPVDEGQRSTVNSLREAFVSWQSEAGQTLIEFGRINLRYGPAYGYNPTDFLRSGSVRSQTSVDPLSVRENRMGTVMFRTQQLWAGGGASMLYAPKLASGSSAHSFSADFGATNNSHQALVAVSGQLSDKFSGQLLAHGQDGRGLSVGANATWLVSDSTVAFAEWAAGRDTPLLVLGANGGAAKARRHRAVAGATFTSGKNISVTAEFEYNGFAADRAGLSQLARFGSEALGSYLGAAQFRQESASRRAVLLYAVQRGGLSKNTDVTALLRINTEDHSRFAWLELRHHFTKWDVAMQWQRSAGSATSEYGGGTPRQVLQVIATRHF